MLKQETKSVDTYGVDESNYAFMCIGLVSDKTLYQSVMREWTVTTKGEKLTRQLKIEPGVDTGLPTGFDIRLWVALQKIAYDYDRQFTSQWIPFSLYEVGKVMGLTSTGPNRKRIVLGLRRLTATIYWPNKAFWSEEHKQWLSVSGGHHLLASYWLSSQSQDGEMPPIELQVDGAVQGYFAIDPVIRGNLKHKRRLPINHTFYFDLKLTTAAELYRFLNGQMRKKMEYVIDVTDLAKHLGLSGSYRYASEIWKQLKPACEELKAKDYLSSYKTEKRKWGGETHLVVIFKRSAKADPEPQLKGATAPAPEPPPEAAKSTTAEETTPRPTIDQAEIFAPLKRQYKTSEELEELWELALESLQGKMTQATFQTHFIPSVLLSIAADDDRTAVVIGLKNTPAIDWVSNRLQKQIIDTLAPLLDGATKDNLVLEFVCPSKETTE